jgi:hypothetical protein
MSHEKAQEAQEGFKESINRTSLMRLVAFVPLVLFVA